MSDEREADIATLTIDYLQAEIREVALDVLTDYSPEDPPSDADIAYAQRQADAIASRWAMHRDATFADETLRVPASSEPRPEVRDCPLMHGAAPCPMCAYCPHGLTAGRGADERCLECGAAVTEPRPENPYRTVHARMSPPGAAWDEGFAAGRAALPDPPTDNPYCPHFPGEYPPLTAAKRAAWDEGWAAREAAALPDERLREALTRANDDLVLIADEAPEDIGESIDSVRAAIKDALAAADREKPERICCRGMGADGGCNICAAEATH